MSYYWGEKTEVVLKGCAGGEGIFQGKLGYRHSRIHKVALLRLHEKIVDFVKDHARDDYFLRPELDGILVS